MEPEYKERFCVYVEKYNVDVVGEIHSYRVSTDSNGDRGYRYETVLKKVIGEDHLMDVKVCQGIKEFMDELERVLENQC